MNPIKNKKDLEATIDEIRNFAYLYLDKYSPSKQQLRTYLFKKLVKKIDLVHFNDSKDGFESSRDRHENLGKGNIPKEDLEYVINNAKTDLIVETPNGPDAQKKDIAWIKRRIKK